MVGPSCLPVRIRLPNDQWVSGPEYPSYGRPVLLSVEQSGKGPFLRNENLSTYTIWDSDLWDPVDWGRPCSPLD